MILNAVDIRDGEKKATNPMFRGKVFGLKDFNPSMHKALGFDVTLHDDNFAFVSTKLAKLHEETYEPEHYITYIEDVPVDVGQGFVDYIEYYTIDYAGIASNTRKNLFGNQANVIPRINAAAQQNTVPVFVYEMAYDLKWIELEKLNKLQFTKSIEQLWRDGIRVGYDLFAQIIAYEGVAESTNAPGLFNNPNVKVYAVPSGVSTGTKFADLTDEEIVSFFNGVMATYLVESNMNLRLLPDTFLLPIADGQELSSRINTFFTKNLRNYIKENNFGIDEIRDSRMAGSYNFDIKSRPQLDALGGDENGRIVVYRKDKRYVRMDNPYPLQQYYTGPNVERAAYTTYFVAQLSAVQMPFNDGEGSSGEFGPVTYWDFGEDVSAIPVIADDDTTGTTFTEGDSEPDWTLGITATDPTEGDLTSEIVIVDTAADMDTVGTFDITYDVADSAGNDAVQYVKTITIEAA
ncbi:hypothetical protein DRO61_00905 [Candidatus Bathyarchaeota archaeon]|nr:MAG: hypothetical protein DRO61_00905 [Candidatus Bathyarchaeota archaeon]